VPTVAAAIDLVIQVKLDQSGFCRVTELLFVTGRSEGGRIEVEDIWSWRASGYEVGVGAYSLRTKIAELMGAINA
jgi:hypothetical protein